MRLSFSLLAAAIVAASFAQAPPKNMTFSTTLKSVAVFRDGFGYYVREGKVKLEKGWATTDIVPSAIKGTVRFYTLDKADKIDQVVIGKENKIEFSGAADIKTKLADKIGLKLVVVTNSGQRFEGELSKILDDMLLLRMGSAYSAVPYDQIQSILFAGFPVRIKIDTKDPNKVVSIGVAYLQEGIRWEPSYILDVHKGEATLSLRASMQNTTENLDKSNVFFVVGSPFVANRGIQDMLAPIPMAPPAVTGKDSGPERRPTAIGEPGSTEKAAIANEEAGELYYYQKPELSLATNDIAMVSIFDVTVPVAPSYEWNADGEEVSYLLSLVNKSAQPLTTGPVFVLEDGKAIGQENVKYTPAGGTAEIRLARGIGLKVEKKESEVKRGGVVHVGKTDYIPVLLKGTLTITNYRTTASSVKVTKTSRGKMGDLSDKGEVKQTQILSGEPNPINDLEWKVVIAPGATKTITYSFETYMSAERAGSPPIPDRDGDHNGR